MVSKSTKNMLKILLLIVVPWIAIIFTAPIYNKPYPQVGGWPFLWWYLFAWVFIQPILTYIVYRFIDRGEGQ